MMTTVNRQSPDNYVDLLGKLKERIRAARIRAAFAVNGELILLYWSIGHEILVRQGEEGWGAGIVARLAADLKREFPEMTGFSERNLKYMRMFAEAYPNQAIVQQLVAQLPWGHNIRLLESVKDSQKREWYVRQAIEFGWSRNVLIYQIESGLYERQGKAQTNFSRTLPAGQSELAQDLIKDPYCFDFLELGPDLLERDLERGLLEHLRSLILELGKGFAFVASQYLLEIGGQEYYLDLLFYHLRLRCFVVVELKIDEFKPEFAGKMNFYLSAVDDQLRQATDAPTIGIILCKERNRVVVEYALRDTMKPMGVAEYRLSNSLPTQLAKQLPTADELSREFPAMQLVRARIEIERAIRSLLSARGIYERRPAGIAQLISQLKEQGLAPSGTEDFLRIINVLNASAHGIEIDGETAEEAQRVSESFLNDLRTVQEQ